MDWWSRALKWFALGNDAKTAAQYAAEYAKGVEEWAEQQEAAYRAVLASADQFVAQLELETRTMGMTSEERQRYIVLMQLEAQTQQRVGETAEEYAARLESVRAKIAESPHSRVVVCRGGLEHILGVLKIGDLLKPALRGEALDVERALTPPLFVPETISTQQLLESFRKERVQFGLVVDEYGDLQGLVSLTDVLTSIVGDLPEPDDAADTDMVRREDGSWLVDGSVGIERIKQVLEIDELPAEDERAFHTVGGFAMHRLGRIPTVADHFDASGYRFEVVDMDRNRVDKMLVAKLPDPTPIEVEEP